MVENRVTNHIYESSKRIWRTAKARYQQSLRDGKPDFSHITEAENNIRKNSQQILFEKAAVYGNVEVQRAKSRDDTVGPMNQLHNIGGAAMREFVIANYPQPDLQQVLSEDGEVRFVYPASSFGPEIEPIHVTLPEMDFIDSCREHIQVLDTHSFIYDVENRNASRYCNLFLLKARPYLDYIYSEHIYGKAGFREGTLRTLKELKERIARTHSIRIGKTSTVTTHRKTHHPKFDVGFFQEQINDAISARVSSIAIDEIQRVLDGGSITETVLVTDSEGNIEGEEPAPCLTKNDVEFLWKSASALARKRGTQVHRLICSQFPSFWSIKRAILNDEPTIHNDGYLMTAEIPVDTERGKGRVDLVLLRREATADGLRILWRPIFLLEIKSKLGFYWELDDILKESESRRRYGLEQRVVSNFPISTRPLDDNEWRAIIESQIDDELLIQVNTYANAVCNEYMSISGDESNSPILRGTLFIDAEDDVDCHRSLIRGFAIRVYESASSISGEIQNALYEPIVGGDVPKLAIVLHKQELEKDSTKVFISPPRIHTYNPLTESNILKRHFILYLSASSATSGGKSAAWISQYYNGLQEIHEMAKEANPSNLIWLDLADEFTKPRLAETRLRLLPYSKSEDDKYRSHPDGIRKFFESFEIHGFYKEIGRFLMNDGPLPSIESMFHKIRGKSIVVVSGWEWIKKSTPEPYRSNLNKLLGYILDQLPRSEGTTIIWFDTPEVTESSSPIYQTRTLVPFHESSPLYGEVNEIIWNMPSAPRREVNPDEWILPVVPAAPVYDDIRVIITQTLQGYGVELTHIPALMGWSDKFRSEGLRFWQRQYPKPVDIQLVPEKGIRDRIKILAFELIPWLPDLWPDFSAIDSLKDSDSELLWSIRSNHDRNIGDIKVAKRILKDGGSVELSILQRMKYRPKGIRGGKSYQSLTANRINSQRFYRGPNELKTNLKPSYESKSETTEPVLGKQKDVAFGRIISTDDSQHQSEAIVVENPYQPGNVLVGVFTERVRPSQSGFVWSVHDSERLEEFLQTGSSTREIDLLLRKTGDRWESWSWDSKNKEWNYRGIAELITGREGRVSELKAIREMPESSSHKKPVVKIPEWFNKTVDMALKRLAFQHQSLNRVSLTLHSVSDQCKVSFTSEKAADILHEVTVQGTADLIDLLRWPLKNGGPMPIRNSARLYWSPFEDIEYGEFDAIRPFVETKAPHDVKRTLPPLVKDLHELSETLTVTAVLTHDEELCPLVNREISDHRKCWRVEMRSKSTKVQDKKFAMPLNGKQVFGLLSSKQIIIDGTQRPLQIEMTSNPDAPESIVLHENYWIRRLMKEYGRSLPRLASGTYLKVRNQKWVISFSFEGNWIVWTARSDVTGLLRGKPTFDYRLNPSLTLNQATKQFIESLTDIVPKASIKGFSELKTRIRGALEKKGYSKSTPDCILELSTSKNQITIALTRADGKIGGVIAENKFVYDRNVSIEMVLERVQEWLEFGPPINCTIANETEIIEELQSYLIDLGDFKEDDESESQMDFETELKTVVKDLREEAEIDSSKLELLAHSLSQLAHLHLEKQDFENAFRFIDESISILENQIQLLDPFEWGSSLKRKFVRALITKRKILNRAGQEHYPDDIKKVMQEKFEFAKEQMLSLGRHLSDEDRVLIDEMNHVFSENPQDSL